MPTRSPVSSPMARSPGGQPVDLVAELAPGQPHAFQPHVLLAHHQREPVRKPRNGPIKLLPDGFAEQRNHARPADIAHGGQGVLP